MSLKQTRLFFTHFYALCSYVVMPVIQEYQENVAENICSDAVSGGVL